MLARANRYIPGRCAMRSRANARTFGSSSRLCAYRGECFCGVEEASLGGRPIDTRVGDRHAVFERGAVRAERLAARFDIALEHRAHDRAAAGAYLVNQGLEHFGLFGEILAGLRVRAIDHHARLERSARQNFTAFLDTGTVVVR